MTSCNHPPGGADRQLAHAGQPSTAIAAPIPYRPRPTHNARGRPWTSRGNRNLSISKPRHGNGDVAPPLYERRRHGLPSDELNDAFHLADWRITVDGALRFGLISRALHGLLHVLASYSNHRGQHVNPAQSEIGNRADLHTDYVNHLLREARDVGLLEWVQVYEAAGRGMAVPRTCVYAFTFNVDLLKTLGMKRRLKTVQQHRRSAGTGSRVGKPLTPKPERNDRESYDTAQLDKDADRKQERQAVDRLAHQQADLASNTTFREAEDALEEELTAMFAPNPVPAGLRERASYELTERWKARRGPAKAPS